MSDGEFKDGSSMSDTEPEGIEHRTCGKCGKEYESYQIIFTKDFVSTCEHVEMKEEYGNVCMECYREECPSGRYALEEW